VYFEHNPYGPEPTPTYKGLYESGEASLMLDRAIAIDCPVRLLHGLADADVPWKISLKLADALRSNDVRVTLVKDGDHRLSREADITLLLATVVEMTA
jgi:dipeptidyl aminopeptidase/acylaminoacyl peptidase